MASNEAFINEVYELLGAERFTNFVELVSKESIEPLAKSFDTFIVTLILRAGGEGIKLNREEVSKVQDGLETGYYTLNQDVNEKDDSFHMSLTVDESKPQAPSFDLNTLLKALDDALRN